MAETITDCEVGLASVLAPPLAWYDNNNGEIGDICNAQQGSILGGDGQTYTVQKEFSNVANACIVTASSTPTPTATLRPTHTATQLRPRRRPRRAPQRRQLPRRHTGRRPLLRRIPRRPPPRRPRPSTPTATRDIDQLPRRQRQTRDGHRDAYSDGHRHADRDRYANCDRNGDRIPRRQLRRRPPLRPNSDGHINSDDDSHCDSYRDGDRRRRPRPRR